jgi:homoserine dehydrogenase
VSTPTDGEVRVGLLGYGTVGSAVDRLLRERSHAIQQATGRRLIVVRALVRDLAKPRATNPEPGVLTTDFQQIRDDPSIALVAEVMGGLDPAERYTRELLAAGKPLVTANKKLIARRGAALAAAASAAALPVRFEAAVCAVVPVVQTLCEALPPASVQRLTGVVNGTANYILTRMEQGLSYMQALKDAQALGYAEADPSEDTSGADAAAKLAVLARLAFGISAEIADIPYSGIEGISPRDLARAADRGLRLRLLVEAHDVGGVLVASVAPQLLPATHALVRLAGAGNGVVLTGDAIGELTLCGPGAGGPQTALAVIADLLALTLPSPRGHLDRLAAATPRLRWAPHEPWHPVSQAVPQHARNSMPEPLTITQAWA